MIKKMQIELQCGQNKVHIISMTSAACLYGL